MNNADERLDRAVERFVKSGEISEDLQAYSAALEKLQALDPVPERDTARASAMRERFIDQAVSSRATVSPSRTERLKGWMSIFRKERSPMFTVARIITIAAILMGGTAGTAFAAQESLPDQALYPVKILIEDIRLGLATDPHAEFDLLMTYIDERFAEIQIMAQNGEAVGEAVQLRLQQQLQSAFKNAAELEDQELLKAMEQIRTRSQIQENIFNQFNKGNGNGPNGNLDLAEQAVIRSRIWAEGALEDPTTLRNRYGAERDADAPVQPEILPPGEGQGGSPDEAGDGEGFGPSGPGTSNDGQPGPRRNGQSE